MKESQKIEFKRSIAELKHSLEDICAFANSGEGVLYFGIDDEGEVVGVEVSDNTLKRVSTTILSSIEPRIYPNVYTKKIRGKVVLIIKVKSGPDKPYFYKGKAFNPSGNSPPVKAGMRAES